MLKLSKEGVPNSYWQSRFSSSVFSLNQGGNVSAGNEMQKWKCNWQYDLKKLKANVFLHMVLTWNGYYREVHPAAVNFKNSQKIILKGLCKLSSTNAFLLYLGERAEWRPLNAMREKAICMMNVHSYTNEIFTKLVFHIMDVIDTLSQHYWNLKPLRWRCCFQILATCLKQYNSSWDASGTLTRVWTAVY